MILNDSGSIDSLKDLEIKRFNASRIKNTIKPCPATDLNPIIMVIPIARTISPAKMIGGKTRLNLRPRFLISTGKTNTLKKNEKSIMLPPNSPRKMAIPRA